MFVQVIKGKVSDPGKVRAALDKWVKELSPGATGWLGSTTGVTDDGTLVAVVRFDTEDNARRNNDRPEQGQWWAEAERLFDGGADFAESTDVETYLVGNPDQAGFVQVMEGQVSDPGRVRELMTMPQEGLRKFRPDIVGSLNVGFSEGRWASAIYFTSEEEARQAEAKEPPPELAERMQEMQALSVGSPVFYDLRDPWLASPSTSTMSSTSAG